MFKGQGIFTYLTKRVGVTKDGVQYLCLDVVSKDLKKLKYGFIITDTSLIDKISQRQFHDYQDVKLFFEVSRVFNKEKRVNYWDVSVVDVE